MTTLLVGFDSAWTLKNRGAIVGVVRNENGVLQELELPQIANFNEAAEAIKEWRALVRPETTLVLLDQPTIVKNAEGQRPVENIVGSPVSRRYGGMQPANTSRFDMFGTEAPVWRFLEEFGGAADPFAPRAESLVFETYPVLTMIALEWLLEDHRSTGRLPKYNPQRRITFSTADWQYVCGQLYEALLQHSMSGLCEWITGLMEKKTPSKYDQDKLDACICLLVGLHLIEAEECLMVGETDTGYIVVPSGDSLIMELEERCTATNRDPKKWIRRFTLNDCGPLEQG